MDKLQTLFHCRIPRPERTTESKHIMDISTALDNLALVAATTDRDIVAHLTHANQQLMATNKQLTEQLSKAIDTNANLVKKLGNNNPETIKPKPNTRQPFNHTEWEANLDPTGYCWTHGFKVQKGHDSMNCKGKLGGHQDTTTRANTQGGSTKGKA
jgi:hypothetical protein